MSTMTGYFFLSCLQACPTESVQAFHTFSNSTLVPVRRGKHSS